MANQVEISIVAKDLASRAIDTVVESLKNMGTTGGIIGATFITAGVAIGGALIKAGADADAYADKVRKVQQVTGQTAEESSRMVDVLDKLKISTDGLDAVTRALVKNGLAPTMETLAMLSDQYLQLNTIEERNAFITDQLGRSGFKYVELLQQGGDKLRSMNAATEAGLVLSQRQVDAARENQMLLSENKDMWEQYKIMLGNEVIPIENVLLARELDLVKSKELVTAAGRNWALMNTTEREGFIAEAAAIREAQSATKDYADASERARDRTKGLGEALALTDEQTKQYSEGLTDLQTIVSGDLGKAYDDFSKKIDDLNEKLSKAKKKEKGGIQDQINEETEAYARQTTEIKYNIAAQMINADINLNAEQKLKALNDLSDAMGLQDKATKKYTDELRSMENALHTGAIKGQGWIEVLKGGSSEQAKHTAMVSQAAKALQTDNDATKDLGKAAQNTAEQVDNTITPGLHDLWGEANRAGYEVNGTKNALNDLNGKTAIAYVTIITSGSVPPLPAPTGGGGSGGGGGRRRATGGPVASMQPYVVGEGGPEVFMPARDGAIIPNTQLTYNNFYGPVYQGSEAGSGSGGAERIVR